jgi:hypothetical protein
MKQCINYKGNSASGEDVSFTAQQKENVCCYGIQRAMNMEDLNLTVCYSLSNGYGCRHFEEV